MSPLLCRTNCSFTAAIARVERGLIPEVRVKGERGWSIEERLRAHHVPGVSVAVSNLPGDDARARRPVAALAPHATEGGSAWRVRPDSRRAALQAAVAARARVL